MNIACVLCKQPATLVCKHLQCGLPPFFCQGPCLQQLPAKEMHKHSKFLIKIQQIQNACDANVCHNDYLNSIKKRGEILKQLFSSKVDKIISQHQNDLKTELALKLTKPTQIILNKLWQDINGKSLVGNDIYKIIENQQRSLFVQERWITNTIEAVKKQFNQVFLRLQNLEIFDDYISLQQTSETIKQLLKQAKAFKKQKRKQQALQALKSAASLNEYSFQIFHEIGKYLQKLRENNLAKQMYQKCINLNSSYQPALISLKNLNYKLENKDEINPDQIQDSEQDTKKPTKTYCPPKGKKQPKSNIKSNK